MVKVWNGTDYDEAGGTGGGTPQVERMFYVSDYGATRYATQAAALAGSDSTEGITDTIDAAAAAGGGTVVFDPGFYKVAGALRTDRDGNAQIPLPLVDPYGVKISVSLWCHEPAAAEMYPTDAASHSSAGAILVSTLTGQTYSAGQGRPSVIGSPTVEGADSTWVDSFTNIYLTLHGIAVRCQPNPSLTAFDLGGVAAGNFLDWRADTTEVGSVINAEPTNPHAVAMLMPRSNNNVLNRVGMATMVGYYGGVAFFEHAVIDYVQCLYLKVALIPKGGTAHAAQIRSASVERCTTGIAQVDPETGITSGGYVSFTIEHFDGEDVTGSTVEWWTTTTHIDDSASGFEGEVCYSMSEGGSTTGELSVIGANRLVLKNRRSQGRNRLVFGPRIAPGIDPVEGELTLPAAAETLIPVEFNDVTYYVPAFAATQGEIPLIRAMTATFGTGDSALTTGAADTGQAIADERGVWGIQTGKAYNVSGSGYVSHLYDPDHLHGILEVDVTMGSPGEATVCFRGIDDSNYLMLDIPTNGGQVNFYKLTNLVPSGVGSLPAGGSHVVCSATVTYHIKIVLTGVTIDAYVDDVLTRRISAPVTGFTNGRLVGFGADRGNDGGRSRYDNLTFDY